MTQRIFIWVRILWNIIYNKQQNFHKKTLHTLTGFRQRRYEQILTTL